MDAEMIARLRAELQDLGLPDAEIARQIGLAVADFNRTPTSDTDRVAELLNRREIEHWTPN